MATCRVCPAEILWATNEFTGRRMPVDPEPVEGGNVLLRHIEYGKPPVAHVTTKAERETLEREYLSRRERTGEEGPFKLFVEHHATCVGRVRVDAGELQGQEALF